MKVLIVEDEALVAMDLAAQIEDMGHKVVGPANNLETALKIAGYEAIDFALLDINLRGNPSIPVARLLQDRGVPFAFLTGYNDPKIGDGFGETEIIPKPISPQRLKRAIGNG